MGQLADDRTPPSGSGLTPAQWALRVPFARNLAEEGEPALIEERCGNLELAWAVDAGRPVHLWRVAVRSRSRVRLPGGIERLVHDELVAWERRSSSRRRVGALVLSAALLVSLRALVVDLEDGFEARVVLACLVAAVSVVALGGIARDRRIWRELELGCAGDMTGAIEAAGAVSVYARARRTGDAATAAQAHRFLWERAATDLTAPASPSSR